MQLFKYQILWHAYDSWTQVAGIWMFVMVDCLCIDDEYCLNAPNILILHLVLLNMSFVRVCKEANEWRSLE